MPAQPLNTEELADAARLKALFVKWQQGRKDAGESGSQETAAALLGFGQSALSQYLNGKIPLNVEAAIKFAEVIGRPVSAFSPQLADQVAKYASAVDSSPQSLNDAMDTHCKTPEEMKLLTMYRLASPQERKLFNGLVDDISIRLTSLARNKG